MGTYIEDDIIIYGKYEGEYLADVADEDPDYLYWMIGSLNLSYEEEMAIEDELKRVDGQEEE